MSSSVATAFKSTCPPHNAPAALTSRERIAVSIARLQHFTARPALFVSTRTSRCTALRYVYPLLNDASSFSIRSGTGDFLRGHPSRTWTTASTSVINTLPAHRQAPEPKPFSSSTSTGSTVSVCSFACVRMMLSGSRSIVSFCGLAGTQHPLSNRRQRSPSTSSTPTTRSHFRENSTSMTSIHLSCRKPITVAERRQS